MLDPPPLQHTAGRPENVPKDEYNYDNNNHLIDDLKNLYLSFSVRIYM